MKDPSKVIMGKKNRTSGRDFELRVRKDLESKGWIVDKFGNNVEFEECTPENCNCDCHLFIGGSGKPCPECLERKVGKLIIAKNKWAGPNRPMMMSVGFPDFVCFKVHDLYHVQFVECKTNGYLDKTERQKCQWLQNQGYNILIASKHKIKNRIHIEYKQFFPKDEEDKKMLDNLAHDIELEESS